MAPPAAPLLQTVDEPNSLCVLWSASPALTQVSLWMRQVGQTAWLAVDSSTATLKPTFPAIAKVYTAALGTATVKGLSPEKPYEAKLTARNAHGWSKSSPISAPVQLAKPVAPAAPVLQAADTGTRVLWSLPPGQPVASTVTVHMRQRFPMTHADSGWMVVDHRTKKLVTLVTEGATPCPALPNSIVVTGLNAERPYEAKLVAHTAHGSSDPSPVGAMLQLNKPKAPEEPIATASAATSMRIRLAAPRASPACTHIVLQMQAVNEEAWLFVDNATGKLVPGGGQPCSVIGLSVDVTVSGLRPGCGYRVKALARNAHGWSHSSPVSAAVCTGTKPGKPPAPILVKQSSSLTRYHSSPLSRPASAMAGTRGTEEACRPLRCPAGPAQLHGGHHRGPRSREQGVATGYCSSESGGNIWSDTEVGRHACSEWRSWHTVELAVPDRGGDFRAARRCQVRVYDRRAQRHWRESRFARERCRRVREGRSGGDGWAHLGGEGRRGAEALARRHRVQFASTGRETNQARPFGLVGLSIAVIGSASLRASQVSLTPGQHSAHRFVVSGSMFTFHTQHVTRFAPLSR